MKASFVLNVFFFLFLAVACRVWQLSILKHEKVSEQVIKPRQKVFMEPAKRGGIYDRYGITLATNKIQYQVGIFYPPIRQIPSIQWKRKKGEKLKSYPRREYIHKLSHILAEVLHLEPERIEDLIHSKASLLFDAPLILSEEVTEEQYYRLKTMENHWPGIFCGMGSKRVYPKGKTACHLLGYMGAINRKEYEQLQREKKALKLFLDDWQAGYFPAFPTGFKSLEEVRNRYKELIERSYSIYDWVGKAGVEAKFDQELRGYYGQKVFYADAKGQFLKAMGSSQGALSGSELKLTISAELQEYAEELLIENEKIREGRSIRIDPTNGSYVYQKQPWLKGGAIVAMDPHSGEIYALASNPRYDPNDFILSGNLQEKEEKNKNLKRWLENESFVADLWDQKQPLVKEIYHRRLQKIIDEKTWLSWKTYLSFILPEKSQVKEKLLNFEGLDEPLQLQTAFEVVMDLSEQTSPWNLLKALYPEKEHIPYPNQPLPRRAQQQLSSVLKEKKDQIAPYKRVLDDYFSGLTHHYDKLLLVDLCRLALDTRRFSSDLRPYVKDVNIQQHRDLEAAYVHLRSITKKMCQPLFEDIHFKSWKKVHQKSFLKIKRKEEKQAKSYPKPYIDYLDEELNRQFEGFWDYAHEKVMAAFLNQDTECSLDESLKPYLEYFALWAKEMEQGAHQSVTWRPLYEKLAALYTTWPKEIVTFYLRTFRSFQELDRPLWGSYLGLQNQIKPTEKDLAKSFYPKHGYSFARSYAFSQATPQGSLFKLVTAYAALKQMYEKHPQGSDEELNPLTFVDDLHLDPSGSKWNVGFFKNGQAIPQMYKGGRMPRSHRKGLGKLDVKEALALTSNTYFALLSADVLKSPTFLNDVASEFSFGRKTGLDIPGEISGFLPKDLEINPTGLYSYSIGQHTLVVSPIQSAVMLSALANQGKVLKPQIVSYLKGLALHNDHLDFLSKQEFMFQKHLSLLGIDYPLFMGKERGEESLAKQFKGHVVHEVDLPSKVQRILFEGMKKAVIAGTANPARVRSYSHYHPVWQSYDHLKNQVIGKTSTAEIREIIDLDLKEGVNTYKHVWFGGIFFKDDVDIGHWKEPELIVIVYLRYGDFGREAAPLAAAIAEKWRKIKRKYEN